MDKNSFRRNKDFSQIYINLLNNENNSWSNKNKSLAQKYKSKKPFNEDDFKSFQPLSSLNSEKDISDQSKSSIIKKQYSRCSIPSNEFLLCSMNRIKNNMFFKKKTDYIDLEKRKQFMFQSPKTKTEPVQNNQTLFINGHHNNLWEFHNNLKSIDFSKTNTDPIQDPNPKQPPPITGRYINTR